MRATEDATHLYLATLFFIEGEWTSNLLCGRHGIKEKKFGKGRAGDEELEELLNDPETLTAVLDNTPPRGHGNQSDRAD